MFSFMHKYRVWILTLMLLSLGGFGAWGAIQGLFDKKEGSLSKEFGTFRIPGSGEVVSVTFGEWYDTARNVARFEENLQRQLGLPDRDNQRLTWVLMVLARAAEAAGVVVSDAELDAYFRASGGLAEDEPVKVSDWQRQFNRDLFQAMELRANFYTDPGGPTYAEIYERFKQEHEEVRGRFLVFERKDPKTFTLDLENEDDKKKLIDFFDGNEALKAELQLPEQVDLEAVWVRHADLSIPDFEKRFDETWAELAKDVAASEEEVLARYNEFKSLYDKKALEETVRRQEELERLQREEDEKARAEGREPKDLTPTGDQPSTFELAKGYVERELKLGKLLQKAWGEAQAGETSLADLATKYKLVGVAGNEKLSGHAVVEKKSKEQLFNQADFGSVNVAQTVFRDWATRELTEGQIVKFKGTPGKLLQDIFDQPTSSFAILKLLRHHDPRPPELWEVREKVYERWQIRQADDALKKEAEDFIAAVRAKVDERIAEPKAALEAARDQAVESDLKDQGLDRANEEHKARIEAIEASHQREMEAKLDKESATHEAAAFQATAEEKGLAVGETGWIRKSAGTFVRYTDEPSLAEKKNRLFRDRGRLQRLAALEPGRMIREPELEPLAGVAVVTVLDEKRTPPPSALYDYPTLTDAVRSSLVRRPGFDAFSYNSFRSPDWFALDAPETQKAIEAEEAGARRQRERDAEFERIRRAKKEKEDAEKRAKEEAERRAREQTQPPADGNAPPADGNAPPAPGDVPPPPRDGTPPDDAPPPPPRDGDGR